MIWLSSHGQKKPVSEFVQVFLELPFRPWTRTMLTALSVRIPQRLESETHSITGSEPVERMLRPVAEMSGIFADSSVDLLPLVRDRSNA